MFQVQATIQKVQTMADNTIQLRVGTQEISAEETAKLFNLNGKLGWFTFSEAVIEEKNIIGLPEIEPEFRGEKTPGQRLRGAFFRLWEQQGKKGDFELYYKVAMERLITQVKEKLI